MAIELWRPMREKGRPTDEMERLIEETFGPFEGRLQRNTAGHAHDRSRLTRNRGGRDCYP